MDVWISRDGTSTLQTEILTVRWADRIQSGHIRRAYAWYFFQLTINKFLYYPLATTNMEKQPHYAKSPALRPELQSSGLPINIERTVSKGPKNLLGLKNGSMYGTQGKKHLYVILNEIRADSITGRQIIDTIKAHRIEIGIPQHIFRNCLSPL